MTPMSIAPCRPVPALALLAVAAALLAAAVPAAFAGDAQTWDYKSYRKDRGGQYSKENYNTGTISIEPDGSAWRFRLMAPQLDVCYHAPLPAEVERTDATTTITVEQPVQGCDVFRYIIRNDGSGGTKEVMRGGKWKPDGFDHGLTPHH